MGVDMKYISDINAGIKNFRAINKILLHKQYALEKILLFLYISIYIFDSRFHMPFTNR